MEQRKNRTHIPPRVDPQAVNIPSSPTPQTIRKAKAITTTPPHQIPLEEKEYSPPRVKAEPVMPAPQLVHKYPARHENRFKIITWDQISFHPTSIKHQRTQYTTNISILCQNQSLTMKQGSHLNTDT